MEDVPTMMTITKLLAAAPQHTQLAATSPRDTALSHLKVHCLRLIELTQRTSAVMKVSERHFDRLDPVINVFRTFAQLNEVIVTAKMSIVPDNSFADSVQYQALSSNADMVIVPWTSDIVHYTGGPATIPQDEFVKQVLDRIESHVTVVIDTSLHLDDESPLEPSLSRSISVTSLRHRATRTDLEIEPIPVANIQEGCHVFLAYFGGKDDQVALKMVIQLLRSPEVSATVVRIRHAGGSGKSPVTVPAEAYTSTSKDAIHETESIDISKSSSPITSAMSAAMAKLVRFPSTLAASTSAHLHVDNVPKSEDDDVQVTGILDTIPADIKSQMRIEEFVTSTPLQYAVKRAKREIELNTTNYHLVVVGRGVRLPRPANLTAVLRKDLRDTAKGGSNEMVGKSCLGEVGEAMLLEHLNCGLLIVQSEKEKNE